MLRKTLAFSILAIVVFLVLFSIYILLFKITVIEIQSKMGVERITIICGTKLIISFNNSVTGSPVILVFEVYKDGFQGVSIVTDDATIEYYTAGVIDINSSIKAFKSKVLGYCSSQKVRVLIGEREFLFKDICVTFKVKPYIDLQS